MLSNGKKILIVDDDLDILEALQITFELEGYESYTIAKADEAYQLVDKIRPDIIVLDVLLSGKDGRLICKHLKTTNATKHIPIIMISAHPDAAISALAAGANGFMAKPFDLNKLISKVEHFLN